MNRPHHLIEMHQPSEEFAKCWQAAGRFLSNKGDGNINWLKANLTPPFLEHLSFRLGNQLFYVQVIDVDGALETPGSTKGLETLATGCNGIACLMPMKKIGGEWEATQNGWGLIELASNTSIEPVSFVSDEEIEMTDWELLDFAVQVVRGHVEDDLGFDVTSSQSNPLVQPSLWFQGEEGLEWVIVKTGTSASKNLIGECDIASIKERCGTISSKGHVAVVTFANEHQGFSEGSDVLPILRGHGAHIQFKGLEKL